MAIKRIQTTDRLVLQMQTNLIEVLDPLVNNPLSKGHLINNISLISGITNVVPTGLNRNLVGWFLTRLNGNSVIWDSQLENKTPSQNLQLLCSADCIVSIFVF